MILSKPKTSIMPRLKIENETLPDLLKVHRKIKACALSTPYSIKDGILYYNKGRFYLGESSTLKLPLLEEFHNSYMAGHRG